MYKVCYSDIEKLQIREQNKLIKKWEKSKKPKKKINKRRKNKNKHKGLSYSQLLKLPEWERKRKQILIRDNYICHICMATTNLQIHHKKYIPGRFPWQYNEKHLITLCDSCHKKEHPEIEAKKGNKLLDEEFAFKLYLEE